MTAVPPPDEAQLARGADLNRRLHAIADEVRMWAAEVDASHADRLERVEERSRMVLDHLQDAIVDMGVLAMIMSEQPV